MTQLRQRCMSRLRVCSSTLIVAILFTSGYAQTPAKKTSPTPRTDPCAQAVNESRQEGFLAGWADATKTIEDLAEINSTTSLGDNAKPLKISILVEKNIAGADSYRYAAAEVIRTQFGDWFVVEPNSELSLYISGTDVTKATGYEIQHIQTSVVAWPWHTFAAGKQNHRIVGKFEFQQTNKLLTGYSAEQRTAIVREMVYSVLSEFTGKWLKSQAE